MPTNFMNSIMVKKPRKNMFDLTHDHKTTLNLGWLVPTTAIQCVPGDRFNIGCETLVRFQPLIAPVMHRLDVYMHYFFVPFRLLWENWEQYITSGVEGSDVPVHPYIHLQVNQWQKGSLADYLGVPQPSGAGQAVDFNINAFYFAAYQKIYNDYYRDQNQIAEVEWELTDGGNPQADFNVLRRRAWEHDYFTSALPWAQKGGAVEIPIGGFDDIPVAFNTSTGMIGAAHWTTGSVTDGLSTPQPAINVATPAGAIPGPGPNDLFARTSLLTAAQSNINDLRTAIVLQEWLEKNARSGTRYIESILAHFGVHSSDKRLQRPEYITGTKSPIIISEILQTGESGITPQGNMAGHGISVQGHDRYGSYFCEEHGLIMGIMSIMPKTAYNNGIERMMLVPQDRFEYFWPEFANIGEQPVYNAEVYAWTNTALETFGYMPRYSQYKTMHSKNSADMRDNLRFWTFTRNFDTQPALNSDFIECIPTDDPFAVTDVETDHIIAHVLHKIRAVRPMPKFGTPTF